jgi:hypothetical protein
MDTLTIGFGLASGAVDAQDETLTTAGSPPHVTAP